MINIKNKKLIDIIKNISYTISSNLLSFSIATLVILVVPKHIGVEGYGYWQLYMLYSAYVFFFNFGWNDGIYLKHGGDKYKDLDKSLFYSQFYMLTSLQFIIVIIITFVSIVYVENNNRAFILQMTAICMVISNLRYMLLFILQATNRIKEYARITIIDRSVYFIFIISFIFIGFGDFKIMVIADLIGKFSSLILGIYFCKELIFGKISLFYLSFKETLQYIQIGIKLTFANIANRLIIGFVKFGVEFSWGIETFGKVALTLSISNLMMTFISAVGMVMFPLLRRTKRESLSKIYILIRELLMVLLFGFLTLYYPLNNLLNLWLPEYSEGLVYMALLFPIFIYEGKMSLLINTYLKTLREEKKIMKVNLLTLALSILTTVTFTIILKNLDLVVLSIMVLIAFRCLIAEVMLAKIMEINILKNITIEIIISILFILISWFVTNSWIGGILYCIVYLYYVTIKRRDILVAVKNLREYL
jgi:O-antigen/teichoic acid export membrane protein